LARLPFKAASIERSPEIGLIAMNIFSFESLT